MIRKALVAALLTLAPFAAAASNCNSNPFTLTNGTNADATQVMADFNNLLNCANNNLAHNGSNSDITALSGLTTPLSVTQGGTGSALGPVPRSYLAGMTLSNDGVTPNSVIDIAPGYAADSTNVAAIQFTSTFTKSTGGAWVQGSGANGLGVGVTLATATWYHVCAAIINSVADAFLDTSAACANQPGGTTAVRRIGSIRTDGASHIQLFTQTGDRFDWTTPFQDISGAATSLSPTNRVLAHVPLGITTIALLTFSGVSNGSSSSNFVVSTTIQQLQASGTNRSFFVPTINTQGSAIVQIPTDTAQTVVTSSDNGVSVAIDTFGWIDTRGKLN